MRRWNGSFISATRRAPSSSAVNGIYDLNSQLIAVSGSNWPVPPVPSNIIQTGLNLWLDAANASSYSGSGSTWSDVSGNGNDATLSGTYSLDSTDGGGSIHFNTGRATVGVYTNSIAAGGGSIETWCKIVSGASFRHIAGWRGGAESFYLLLQSSSPNKLEARITGGANQYGDIIYNGTTNFWSNNWNHLVYTVDPGNTAVLYLNGSSVNSQNHSHTFTDSSNDLTLAGAGTLTNQEQKHSVFRYYTKPLTAAEVLNNYDEEKTRHGRS